MNIEHQGKSKPLHHMAYNGQHTGILTESAVRRQRRRMCEACTMGEHKDCPTDACPCACNDADFRFTRKFAALEREIYNLRPRSMSVVKVLPPHQARVIAEKRELDEKLVKLSTFLDGETFPASLTALEHERLKRQRSVMEIYSDILAERIANF